MRVKRAERKEGQWSGACAQFDAGWRCFGGVEVEIVGLGQDHTGSFARRADQNMVPDRDQTWTRHG